MKEQRPLGGGAMMVQPTGNGGKRQQTHVYNAGYKGQTYAVKYLGIVDGAMGILSRKMAMPNYVADSASKPLVTTEPTSLPVRMNNMVKMVEPEWKMEKN
jgi:hypothetical protein